MAKNSTFTAHPEASFRELWSISYPLMISTLASLFMIFTDRIFLARYSLSAMNAVTNAGTLAWAFMAGFSMITAMSEVFVAQYNGAKRFEKLGTPVWQMLWFSLFSFAFFIPMGIWGSDFVFRGDPGAVLETDYFRWLMFFGPSVSIMTAFAGFFIGRGKTSMLIWLAVIANVINIALDWVLIFGIPGIVPELGVNGAAIATCLGYVFQAAMLGYFFLRKSNREQFGTSNWHLDWAEMKKCFRVGIPQGVFSCLEIVGWAVFYWMMTSVSEKHITVSSICQSFVILLSFFFDGLSRGAAAVAGNLIGAKKHHLVSRVLRSGFWLLLLFSLVTAVFLVIDSKDTTNFLFFDHFNGSAVSLDASFEGSLSTCLIFAFIYLFFEGCRWLLSGLLVAAG
ncbi:MAG TPA: MATE family efflux transporter, partial [Chlamydiales bacterium]